MGTMASPERTVTICRRVSFSSGHRYFNPDWSDSENRRVYGSQYSEHGHGHNYVLEAYFEGPVDPLTGMVVNLKDVDVLLRKVTDPLDHHFLNTDIPDFRTMVPTTENLAAYCFDHIQAETGTGKLRLRRVRLIEGSDLWVDCCEEECHGSSR
jgi:6-pyruvoyltetrahydropterin/6-carboxytetrahydropterin synthase